MQLLTTLLQSVNEILTAGVVIIASSMLLYNLTRDLKNRVARSSGTVLACVTIAYVTDALLSLNPDHSTAEIILRLQWLGIAFIPSAMFHLSDALLGTTGLPSRGRRRAAVRFLYIVSGLFLWGATQTDVIIIPIVTETGNTLQGGELFWLFGLFFVLTNGIAFNNLNRARKRCVTKSTRRRMAYLQATILMPALGIFPYSVLLNNNADLGLTVLGVVNLTNIVVILMLIFLAYPLSFFGSTKPDRIVKQELLRFLLLGPGTGILALVIIVFVRRAGEVLSIASEDFLPFAVVAGVLVWQWGIDLARPYLESWLIYASEDDEQLSKLQHLSERILTQNDLMQVIEASLESVCDNLQVTTAFLIQTYQDETDILHAIGLSTEEQQNFNFASITINQSQTDFIQPYGDLVLYNNNAYWLIQLSSSRITQNSEQVTIGLLGIEKPDDAMMQDEDVWFIMMEYVSRIEQTLDDLLLQNEIFGALEGLLPQIVTNRQRTQALDYKPGHTPKSTKKVDSPIFDETYEQVRAALRHYWGGPGMSRSRLLGWKIVQNHIDEQTTDIQALRIVLNEAIDKQRPEGEQSIMSPEWLMYNILTMRYVDRKKVADVSRRIAMSQSDLYRKQRIAIEAVTQSIIEMEAQIQ